MRKVNNFIDFLKQYDVETSCITGVEDFIDDTKATSLWESKDLTDEKIFENLNSRSMCYEASRIYDELKLEYLDFINDIL